MPVNYIINYFNYLLITNLNTYTQQTVGCISKIIKIAVATIKKAQQKQKTNYNINIKYFREFQSRDLVYIKNMTKTELGTAKKFKVKKIKLFKILHKSGISNYIIENKDFKKQFINI